MPTGSSLLFLDTVITVWFRRRKYSYDFVPLGLYERGTRWISISGLFGFEVEGMHYGPDKIHCLQRAEE